MKKCLLALTLLLIFSSTLFAGVDYWSEAKYDSSADYWKLKKDGTLVYDGKARLVDEDENVLISYEEMGGSSKMASENDVEGGLAFILKGSITDSSRTDAWYAMSKSGMKYSFDEKTGQRFWVGGEVEGEGGKKVSTKSYNTKVGSLDMSVIFENFGDTVATDVFARYYDVTSDFNIALYSGGVDTSGISVNRVTEKSQRRYVDLFAAKSSYYGLKSPFLDGLVEYSTGLGELSEKDEAGNYKYWSTTGYLHMGGDFVRPASSGESAISGAPIISPFSGIVYDVVKATSDDGYSGKGFSLKEELGYSFEGKAFGSGIVASFMHMKEAPSVGAGYVTAGTTLGIVGGTPSYDPHLHAEFFLKSGMRSKEDMLRYSLMFGTIIASNLTYNATSWRYYFNPIDILSYLKGSKVKAKY